MHFRTIQHQVLYALSAVLLVGCSASPALDRIGSLPDQSASDSASSSAANSPNLCANSLVPIHKDATWSYVNTGVSESPVTLTTTVSDVRSDGFTVATRFDDGTTADQEWDCLPDGLVARSLGSAQATLGLSLQGMSASLLTLNPAGITLPAQLKAGKSWQYALDVTGNVSRNENVVQVSGKINTSLKATRTESVTVPAGTFDAMRIDAVSTFAMNANLYGLYIPVNSSVKSSFWFAPGVGWIKSVQSGDLPGMSINSATELQSYQIP